MKITYILIYSPLKTRQPIERSLKKISSSLGVKSISVNENNVENIYDLVKKYSTYIRNNSEPFLIEFMTYRYKEHCGPNNDDHLGYRDKKEIKKMDKQRSY